MTTDISTNPLQSVLQEIEHKKHRRIRNQTIGMLVVGIVVSLGTYQIHDHGLWGKMVNYNKAPLIALQGTKITSDTLKLQLYRPNGPDTYGSFVEKVTVTVPNQAKPIEQWLPTDLAKTAKASIVNTYPYEKVKTGPWGLVVPLSAKATVSLPLDSDAAQALQSNSHATVTVQDVSGVSWSFTAPVAH